VTSTTRNHLRALLAGAGALAVLLALCATSLAGRTESSGAHAVTIKVTARDYTFKLSKKTAPAGKVTFVVKNAGKKNHNFKITNKKTPILKPGKSAKLIVTFKKAGNFAYTSTVPGDAKKGMKGVFKVTAPAKTKPVAVVDVKAGKQVFVTTGCGACHTLKAAGQNGTIASNLDQSKASLAKIVNIVTNGKSSMQAYKTLLTPTQIQDVANFVFQSRTG
jgi:mono/diheme cytochrome c family protein